MILSSSAMVYFGDYQRYKKFSIDTSRIPTYLERLKSNDSEYFIEHGNLTKPSYKNGRQYLLNTIVVFYFTNCINKSFVSIELTYFLKGEFNK